MDSVYDGFCTRAVGADAQGTSVLSPGFPVALLAVAAFVIAAKSHAALLELYPTLYCATFSLAFAKLSNQLIVRSSSSLLRSPFTTTVLVQYKYIELRRSMFTRSLVATTHTTP